MGQAEEALADLEGEHGEPDLAAVKAFAHHAIGNTSEALSEVAQLVSSSSENTTVQILGGTLLQAAGKSEEALALLTKHQGNLEA